MSSILLLIIGLPVCCVMNIATRRAGKRQGWTERKVLGVYTVGAWSAMMLIGLILGILP